MIFDLAYRLPADRAVTEARQNLGRLGENLACTELERRGYAILARRYRHAGAEIDIVARDGATLVFVEVKAREGREFGDEEKAAAADDGGDGLPGAASKGRVPLPLRRRLDPAR